MRNNFLLEKCFVFTQTKLQSTIHSIDERITIMSETFSISKPWNPWILLFVHINADFKWNCMEASGPVWASIRFKQHHFSVGSNVNLNDYYFLFFICFFRLIKNSNAWVDGERPFEIVSLRRRKFFIFFSFLSFQIFEKKKQLRYFVVCFCDVYFVLRNMQPHFIIDINWSYHTLCVNEFENCVIRTVVYHLKFLLFLVFRYLCQTFQFLVASWVLIELKTEFRLRFFYL